MADTKETLRLELQARLSGEGFKDAQTGAKNLTSRINEMNASGKASVKQIAALQVELDELERQAKEAGIALDGIGDARGGLEQITRKAQALKTAQFNLNDDLKEGTTRARGLKEELFDGATRMEGLRNGALAAGAAFSGGFATGLRIAEAAGVDLRVMMDSLKEAAGATASFINSFVVKTMAGLAEAVGQSDLADNLLEGLEISENARKAVLGKELADKKAAAAEKAAAEAAKEREEALEKQAAAAKKAAAEELELRNALYYAKKEGRQFGTVMEKARDSQNEYMTGEIKSADIIGDQIREQQESEAELDQIQREMALQRAKEHDDRVQALIDESQLKQATAQAEQEQAFMAANLWLGVASQAFGDSKEIAIAEAIINTYQGATKAYAQAGIYGAIAAAAIVAAGMLQVQKIISTNPKTSGGESAPSFDDPVNDAAARLAGQRSASDLVNHYNVGFTERVMSGQGGRFGGATSRPTIGGGSGGGKTEIHLHGHVSTPPKEYVRAFTRAQNRFQNNQERFVRGNRPR